jgi:biotin-(acetyl-CoA carboxylase) ligase
VVIGRDVTVVKLNESYPARVVDINPDYSLLIEHDGVEERLFTGEISIRI